MRDDGWDMLNRAVNQYWSELDWWWKFWFHQFHTIAQWNMAKWQAMTSYNCHPNFALGMNHHESTYVFFFAKSTLVQFCQAWSFSSADSAKGNSEKWWKWAESLSAARFLLLVRLVGSAGWLSFAPMAQRFCEFQLESLTGCIWSCSVVVIQSESNLWTVHTFHSVGP